MTAPRSRRRPAEAGPATTESQTRAAGDQCHPDPTTRAQQAATTRPHMEGRQKPPARIVAPPIEVELRRDPTISDAEARRRLRIVYSIILDAAARADAADAAQQPARGGR